MEFPSTMISAPLGLLLTCATRVAWAQVNIQPRLNILHLNASRVGLVALQPQHQVVLSRRERKYDRSLAGLLCAVDEDVCSRRLGADKDAFGQRLERELLVLRLAALDLQRRLQRLIAFLLHFQAVALRFEIVETAGSVALAQNIAFRPVEPGGRADDIGDNVNGTASG